MDPALWGEIPPPINVEPPECPASELPNLTDFIPHELLIVGAKLYHNEPSAPEVKFVSDEIPCLRTTHTVKLVEYFHKYDPLLLKLLKIVESKETEKNSTKNKPSKTMDAKQISNILSFRPASPVPEGPEFLLSNAKDTVSDSHFVKGIGECAPQISNQIAVQILRKVVAVITAHVGFEVATDEALNIFTEAAEDYFNTLCKAFARRRSYHRHLNCPLFPDILQATLKDVRIPSMTVLCDFYEKKIIRYHKYMVSKCNELHNNYENLRKSSQFCAIVQEAQGALASCSNIVEENEDKWASIFRTVLSPGQEVDEDPCNKLSNNKADCSDEVIEVEAYEDEWTELFTTAPLQSQKNGEASRKREGKHDNRKKAGAKKPKISKSPKHVSSNFVMGDAKKEPSAKTRVSKNNSGKKKTSNAKKSSKVADSPKPVFFDHVAEDHKKESSHKRMKTKRT